MTLLQRSVHAGHKEIGNGRDRNDDVGQHVLHIPRMGTEGRCKHEGEHDARQRDGYGSDELNDVPNRLRRCMPKKQPQADRADQRDGDIRLDRKEHKDPAAAHKRAPPGGCGPIDADGCGEDDDQLQQDGQIFCFIGRFHSMLLKTARA